MQFLLTEPAPLLYHNEPIWRDDVIVGYLTSGMYGHSLGAAVGLGYVGHVDGVDKDFVESGSYEIEVAGTRFAAKASLKPMFDPGNARIKA